MDSSFPPNSARPARPARWRREETMAFSLGSFISSRGGIVYAHVYLFGLFGLFGLLFVSLSPTLNVKRKMNSCEDVMGEKVSLFLGASVGEVGVLPFPI